jgi:hypothetical protein
MTILIAIYFILGAILGCGLIYVATHDEEMLKEVEELNNLMHGNNGILISYIILILIVLVIALTWPIVLTYCFIKKGLRK